MCNSFKNLRSWKLHCLRIGFLAPYFHTLNNCLCQSPSLFLQLMKWVFTPKRNSPIIRSDHSLLRMKKVYMKKVYMTCVELGFNNDETRVQCRSHQWTWWVLHKRKLQKTLWENFGIKDRNWEFFLNINDMLCLQFDLICFVPVAKWSNYRPAIHTCSGFTIFSLYFIVFCHLWLLFFLPTVAIHVLNILMFLSLLQKC